MHRGTFAALLLTLLLLPPACARSTEPGADAAALDRAAETAGSLLSVDRDEYAPGDTLRLTLRNTLDRPLGYNLCASAWEIRAGDSWRRIEPLRICTAELRGLAPGEAAVWEEAITEEWEAGSYRMVTAVELLSEDERREVYTAPFEVVR